MDQDNIKFLEKLFNLQDTNKKLRLLATKQEQIEQLDRIDADITEKLKKIYVHE